MAEAVKPSKLKSKQKQDETEKLNENVQANTIVKRDRGAIDRQFSAPQK